MSRSRPFRWLMRLFPSDFQADYGRDMERTFSAQRRDADRRGVAAVVSLWCETLRDLVRTAPAQHAEQVRADVVYAVRSLRARPGATLAAVATLAVGIGSVTAILSLVNGVDWRPLTYPDPNRIVFVQERFKGEVSETTGYATFADWRERARSFSGVAAMASMTTTLGGSEPEQLSAMRVTPEFFRVLGVTPALGRAFGDAENRWDNRRFVVLSDRLWRRRFNADPAIVGRAIELGGVPYVVTAVMPDLGEDLIADRVFDAAEIWAPLAYDASLPFACRTCRHIRVIARLNAGITPEAAGAEVDAITRQLAAEHPSSYAGPGAQVGRVADVLLGPVRPALYVLMGAVALLLAIAGVNVANLLLVRSVERGPEVATRRALGVATGRLVRQLLTESVVLAAAGAVCGVALAHLALRGLVALAPESLPRIADVGLDGRVLLLTMVITAGVGIVFGSLPAWQLASADVSSLLRGARTVVAGGGRLGRFLIAANVALAVVLLAVGGLLGRSFQYLLRVDPGFEPSGVTTAAISLAGPAYREAEAGSAFYERVLQILTTDGAEGAFTTQLPIGELNDSAGFHVAGRVADNPEDAPVADRFAVTPGYFSALRIPIVRGRAFDASDRPSSRPVAIINREAARQAFGDDDPVGRHIMLGAASGPKLEIVGVAGDVRHRGLGEPISLQAYVPMSQFYGGPVRLVLRAGERTDTAARIREAVRAVDRTQAVHDIRTFEAVLAGTLAERRFLLSLVAFFAAAALLLAAGGLYGVVSYVVAQRRRDIGLRMALGAAAGDVARLVLRIGMTPVAVGLAGGLLLVTVATRPVQAMLVSVHRFDAAAIGGSAALLLACALAACCLPARRAMRLDPVTALRAE